MTSIKELSRPPDYEIRANIFIHHVREEGMKTKKQYAYSDLFELNVEKALEKWVERFQALNNILGDMDRSALGKFAPIVLADNLDVQSASRCEVEVYASCTSGKPLKEFVDKTLNLAERQGGAINGDFMPMLSTQDKKDMITRLDSEAGESWFISHLFFAFE